MDSAISSRPSKPSRLSNDELIAEVARLARCERHATASLIGHLAELYGRRLHERAGFDSLFTYCLQVLQLSESAAYDRMKAAKVVRRYPEVLSLLASGRVNLTTIRLLAPHLTRETAENLIAEACGKNKRQVQELLARRFPAPDVASSVRKLPGRPVETTISIPLVPVASMGPTPGGPSREDVSVTARPGPLLPSSPRPPVLPLAADRYQFTFAGSRESREELELAQDLLRHALPSGDPAEIFARALHLLVEKLVKDKFAQTDRPRCGRERADHSRNIPAWVKREVYLRDRGRCAFVGAGGHRSGARGFLEFHHVIPYAAGGRPTVDNIELRCRTHNAYEAEVYFGSSRREGDGGTPSRSECVNGDAFSFRHDGQLAVAGRAQIQSTGRTGAGGPSPS